MRRCSSSSLLFLFILFMTACAGERREPDETSFADAPVILISVDTLRADHLPAYGYKNVRTPNIDQLRADGILFTNAYSHVPLTLPSHVSLLTGKLPPDHKVRNNIGYRFDGDVSATLPGVLRQKGYATGAAVSAYVLRSSTGLGALFDFYDDAIASKAGVAVGTLQRPGTTTVAIARQWIEQNKSRPFFFLFHLFEPHSPYAPPEPFRSSTADSYDGEIAAADSYIGELIAFLKANDLYERSIIIFLSDHGEGLNDHGEPEHGIFVYREAIHVPLIVKLPRKVRAGETVARPVGLIDIVPTVAQLTGTVSPAGREAQSLLIAHPDDSRRIYSESLYGRIHLGWSELRSLIDNEHHFIEAPKPELYAIRLDPGERRNILSDERRKYAQLKKELDAYGSEIELPSNIDPEEAAKLAALGYLGSTAPQSTGPLPDPKDKIGEIAEMVAAMRLSTEKKDEQAIAAFREIVRKNPRLADAWNQLALILEANGRYEEAVEAYKKAIELTPQLAGEFGLSLGSILLKLEKFDEAEAHARLGEKTNPAGAHLLLGRVAMARGDLPRAENEVQLALRDQYARLAATVLLAQIYVKQGRLPEAMSLADRSVSEARQKNLGPIESLQFVRGDVLARLDRVDEAIPAFEEEIRNFPNHRQAYANLAVIYKLQGRLPETRAMMERMAAASPNRRTYLFAAHTLDELEDPAGAAIWRRRADSTP